MQGGAGTLCASPMFDAILSQLPANARGATSGLRHCPDFDSFLHSYRAVFQLNVHAYQG